ncbi:helix-turn-helix domain-containing protein [Sporolactobacillus shoreicorticis]|uniref:Helix-turn-helix domain-containing protein n=1 Tax=Sporolactobacillus shoreicorticis TaxID=1923877 RepID=A0ABW5S1Y1_9BACL|nr:helix-turn-helix transcriptional regulator [Sporolactobacillus shoreicorticis]
MNKQLIAKRLISLRANRSREEVSNANHISISALQMYENGQRIPKNEIKVRLANYYETNVQDIFLMTIRTICVVNLLKGGGSMLSNTELLLVQLNNKMDRIIELMEGSLPADDSWTSPINIVVARP